MHSDQHSDQFYLRNPQSHPFLVYYPMAVVSPGPHKLQQVDVENHNNYTSPWEMDKCSDTCTNQWDIHKSTRDKSHIHCIHHNILDHH
jgi:hypothetical protein